ncbi:MAG: exodeoxyribonuclease VII large subunit [Clostridia bacterium]|nr:exodeoxyribonuclease VII large subunit [Clostridia bacterium]
MAANITMTVSQLNEYAAKLISRDFLLKDVRVSGEAANVKLHSSGHLYMSLQDPDATVRCFVPAGVLADIGFVPDNGEKLLVTGAASVYAPGGQFQIVVRGLERKGEGELMREFMRVKRRLEAEGAFDEAIKKPIPALPKRIGIITSETGAVLHDILTVARRRFPKMNLLLYPARVQGAHAAGELAEALDAMDRMHCSVLILARGGGSVEDLSVFNDETVARAIMRCNTPVVSAIGHETDYTIADFVADLRAPTPSAAAEICTPSYSDLIDGLQLYEETLSELAAYQLRLQRGRLEHVLPWLTGEAMTRRIAQASERLSACSRQLVALVDGHMRSAAGALREHDAVLSSLNPLAMLERGYALVEKDGIAVADADVLKAGDIISIRMRGGKVSAMIRDGGNNGEQKL